jgi:hypothetical protein
MNTANIDIQDWLYTETYCCICHTEAFGFYTTSPIKTGVVCSKECYEVYSLNPLAYGEFEILVRIDCYSHKRTAITLKKTIITK